MTGIHKYRNIYVIVGIVFAIIITQSNLDDRTERWILVTYIVLGIMVAEFIGRKISKKKGHEETEVKGINRPWNTYVIVALTFSVIISQTRFNVGTQVTLILAYIVLGFILTRLIVRRILKKQSN